MLSSMLKVLLRKFRAYIKLARLDHAIMLSLAVLITYQILGVYPKELVLYASLLTPFFIEIFAFVMNDYLDINADILNKRKRPLATKEVSKKEALLIMAISLVLALFFTYHLPFIARIIAISFILLSILYNLYLKDIAILGNSFIAFCMVIPFFFAMGIVKTYSFSLEVLGLAIFFGGLGREIIKDIEDIEGDKKARKSKTLPILIGIKKSSYIAIINIIIFIILATWAFLRIKQSLIAYLMLIIAILITAFSIYLLRDPRLNARKVRKYLLYAFIAGLLGFIV